MKENSQMAQEWSEGAISDERMSGLNWTETLKTPGLILLAGLPLTLMVIQSSYFGLVALLALSFGVMASGYNLMLGWPDLLIFCPAALAIIGGVSAVLLVQIAGVPFLIAFLTAGVVAAVVGVGIAYSAILIKSAFEIVIATLAFEQIVFYMFLNWELVGPTGLSGIPSPSIAGVTFATRAEQYVLLLSVLAFAGFLVRLYDDSLVGTLTIATGEDEDLLRSIGYNPSRYKIAALGLGSFLLGLGGALYAFSSGLITPNQFTIEQTIFLMTIVIIGGLRTIYGPILGAIIMVSLPEVTRMFGLNNTRPYLVGLFIIIVVLYYPGGILGSINPQQGGSVWRFWK